MPHHRKLTSPWPADLPPGRIPGVRPPQLDIGTNHIVGPSNADYGKVFVYHSGGSAIWTEHWVVWTQDNLDAMHTGSYDLEWAETADSWATEKSALLGAESPDPDLIRYAQMSFEYISPPGTPYPSPQGNSFKRYEVRNGTSNPLAVRGGMYREVLTTSIIDHWRLYPAYVKPASGNGVTTHVAALSTAGTLSQFFADHASAGGEYVVVQYSWGDLE